MNTDPTQENKQEEIPKQVEVDSNLGLKDPSGGTSSIRVVMVFGSFLILSTWALIAIVAAFHGTYVIPDLPTQISLTLTAILTGKVCQRVFGEK